MVDRKRVSERDVRLFVIEAIALVFSAPEMQLIRAQSASRV